MQETFVVGVHFGSRIDKMLRIEGSRSVCGGVTGCGHLRLLLLRLLLQL